jgi:hypothetical protein
LARASFDRLIGATWVGGTTIAHPCTRSEIIYSCYIGGSTSWATPPSGYIMLLGDTCGDDCQLYVSVPSACNSNSLGNIDGAINPHQNNKFAVRACY